MLLNLSVSSVFSAQGIAQQVKRLCRILNEGGVLRGFGPRRAELLKVAFAQIAVVAARSLAFSIPSFGHGCSFEHGTKKRSNH